MSEKQKLPPLEDDIPEQEREAGPEHRYLIDEEGEVEDELSDR